MARAELWLDDPRGDRPKPLVRCVRVNEKPFLDGRLDDAVWQSAEVIELGNHGDDDPTWPAVAKLARDEQFLYVAVSCRKSGDAKYTTGDEPRTRDADLSTHDRVEILLDVNRDWNSFYRLAVDHRGWTADAAGGDGHWNPTWFAAAAGDEQVWNAEMAIPLAELVEKSPQPRDVWAVGVQRVVPGVGMESWSLPARVRGEGEGLGLMLLE